MEKYDLSEMNDLIKRTGQLLSDDPLLASIDDVADIAENFKAIQDAINNKGMGAEEKTWFLAKVFGSMIGKDDGFQFKTFEGKIDAVFRQYDLVYESIGNTIEVYNDYGKDLLSSLNKLNEFITNVDDSELTVKERKEFDSYQLIVKQLGLSLGRIGMTKESGEELYEHMRIGRPHFQLILSSCMIEVSGQKTIDASVQIIWTLMGTADALTTKLTESAIKSSAMALEVGNAPVLSIGKLEQNVALLGGAINDLNEKRSKYLLSTNTQKDAEQTEWTNEK